MISTYTLKCETGISTNARSVVARTLMLTAMTTQDPSVFPDCVLCATRRGTTRELTMAPGPSGGQGVEGTACHNTT